MSNQKKIIEFKPKPEPKKEKFEIYPFGDLLLERYEERKKNRITHESEENEKKDEVS